MATNVKKKPLSMNEKYGWCHYLKTVKKFANNILSFFVNNYSFGWKFTSNFNLTQLCINFDTFLFIRNIFQCDISPFEHISHIPNVFIVFSNKQADSKKHAFLVKLLNYDFWTFLTS
jgi:hypothetical protein